MPISFQVLYQDATSNARVGELTTPHGTHTTPMFMPVATHAGLRNIATEKAQQLDMGAILANTYHLHIQPGESVVEAMGGLHQFMGWSNTIITDSGGYQVFSLPNHRIDEKGVVFTFQKNGQSIELTPERAMNIQSALGADIVMAFDHCLPYSTNYLETEKSMQRTIRWAGRCQQAANPQQTLFGIVQGGMYEDLRQVCANALVEMDFEGLAIGGLSVGEGLPMMEEMLRCTVPCLPPNKPRYLMGSGLPEDILCWVEQGMDMSDCVIPTKYARGGLLFTKVGRLRITKGAFKKDRFPIDTQCTCSTCAQHTRAYLHHLFQVGDPNGQHLASVHNLHFYLRLMEDIQQAIQENRFLDFKHQFLRDYQRSEKKAPRVQ